MLLFLGVGVGAGVGVIDLVSEEGSRTFLLSSFANIMAHVKITRTAYE